MDALFNGIFVFIKPCIEGMYWRGFPVVKFFVLKKLVFHPIMTGRELKSNSPDMTIDIRFAEAIFSGDQTPFSFSAH